MIATTKKPIEELMKALDGYQRIVIVGCNGCAKLCSTGGSEQVDEIEKQMQKMGKQVLTAVAAENSCYTEKVHAVLDHHLDKLERADAIVSFSCGGGVQVVRKVTEDYGLTIPIKFGLHSHGHMDMIVAGELFEQCQKCGYCELNRFAAICPVTRCPKSLLNGPCGGAQEGKCEVNPDRDCVWILIYSRMLALGQDQQLRQFVEPKDYSKSVKPRKLLIKEGKVV